MKCTIKGVEIEIHADWLSEETTTEWAARGIQAALHSAVNNIPKGTDPEKLREKLKDTLAEIYCGELRPFQRGTSALEKLREQAIQLVPGLTDEVAGFLDARALRQMIKQAKGGKDEE